MAKVVISSLLQNNLRFNTAVDLKLRFLPVKLGLTYLFITFGLFLIWPINWPIYGTESWLTIIFYVLICFVILGFSFNLAARKKSFLYVESEWWVWLIPAGGILAVLLLFPQSYIYTDRWPWEVFEALSDQGESYANLQEQLLLTEDDRLPLVIARFFIAPLVFAVLPLGILKWNDLNYFNKVLVILTAVSTLIFSVLRGTDREFADLFIIGSSSLLVVIGRQAAVKQKTEGYFRRFWKIAIGIIAFVLIASALFIDRKSDRVGGYETRTAVCANESRVCADVDAAGISWLPLSQRFGLSFFILSTTSGYYGLALALEKDFEPTYFVGHSPASLAIYQLITGDTQMATRTFTYRNGYDGWSEENYWSSLVTWIANDVGFVGALFVLALLGWGWARSWIAATKGGNDSAVVIFCQFMLIIFYIPANNQVFAAYEGYSVFFFWMAMWLFTPKKSKV